MLTIRLAEKQDEDAIWQIFSSVVHGGDAYVFPDNISVDDGLGYWLSQEKQTYVALLQNEIVGTFYIRPNMIGRGAHVANAGFMVGQNARGKGIGTQMAKLGLDEAKRLGFKYMQYNMVVATNEAALRLWKKFGFSIIATIPGAFDHKELGFVDACVMYREL